MKEFKKGDSVKIKDLNELTYIQQDDLAKEDLSKLGSKAVFMFYEQNEECVVSIDNHSYQLPLWMITKDESKLSISRPFRIETYQCTDYKELIARIAYIVEKTGFNFKVVKGQKETKLYIEE